MLIWEYVKSKFVTFVSPSAGSHFAAGACAIYYPSHEDLAFSICSPVLELCVRTVCTSSRRASAAGPTLPQCQPNPSQAPDEELVDPHHSAAANI
jgi:hypothetical protein